MIKTLQMFFRPKQQEKIFKIFLKFYLLLSFQSKIEFSF